MKKSFLKLSFLVVVLGPLLFPLPAFGQSGEVGLEEAGGEETPAPESMVSETEESEVLETEETMAPEKEKKEKKNKKENLRILYEGTLTDSEGEVVPDGQYNIRFTIWSEKEEGEILWRESHIFYNGLEVKEGVLRSVLGREVPLSLDLSEAPFFLAVEMGEELENGIEWSGALGPRKEITTLSKLLGERELTEETWAEVEALLDAKLAEEGDVIVLMDMGLLGEEEESGDKLSSVFKKFIDFLSRKVSEISAKLSTVISKLEGISSTLLEMKEKIDALYAAVVGPSSGGAPLEPNASSTPPTVAPEVVEPVSPEEKGFEPLDKGTAVIQEGEEVVKIISSVVKNDSKIFVTFLEDPSTSWWVSQKKEGEFFVVSLHTPAESNLELDYWVVEGDGVSGTEGAQVECVPSDEVCDGKDNDCDGEVDEGVERGCGVDVGVCEAGKEVCSEGSWGECSGVSPSNEICDELDNDCDGEVDEEEVCAPGQGKKEEPQSKKEEPASSVESTTDTELEAGGSPTENATTTEKVSD